MDVNILTGQIIGAAIEVHNVLGPGLLESAYEECLAQELNLRNISHKRQVEPPIEYKGKKPDCGYRLDLVAEDSVIVELKSVEAVMPIHEAQVLTYLKLTDLRLALLINFNVPLIKDGIKRFII